MAGGNIRVELSMIPSDITRRIEKLVMEKRETGYYIKLSDLFGGVEPAITVFSTEISLRSRESIFKLEGYFQAAEDIE